MEPNNPVAPTPAKTTPSLPVSITLGGTEYKLSDTPELLALVTTIGSIERNKIQSTIKDLRTRIEALPEENAVAVDIDKIVAGTANAVLSQLQPTLARFNDFINTTQQETVDQYRTKLLAENADSVIPELVVGKTKEEVDASLVIAKAARARYAAPATVVPEIAPAIAPVAEVQVAAPAQQFNIAEPRVIPTLIAPPVAVAPVAAPVAPQTLPLPTVPVRPTSEYSGPNIKDMNNEDFGKNRAGLLAQIATLVP